MAKKGRPTDKVKDARVTARIPADTKKRLDKYNERHFIGTGEAVRRVITVLLEVENKT